MILTSLSTKADLYQPLAVSCVNFRRWNVTWSASVMSVIQQIQHFCFQTCCNAFSPAPWIPLDYQLHVPELVPVCIFISPSFFPQANCEKGLEHILMQLCMSAAYLCYLLSEVLLSPSYAVTDVGLFIMTRIFIVNRVFFSKLYLLSSFHPRPSVRLSRPPQQHCMWLMNGCFESLSSPEEGFNTQQVYSGNIWKCGCLNRWRAVGFCFFLLSPATFHLPVCKLSFKLSFTRCYFCRFFSISQTQTCL